MTAKKQHIGSSEPATKGDLEQLREDLQADMVTNFATKIELKEEIKAMEGRLMSEIQSMGNKFMNELNRWGKILFEKIDVAVENRQIELGAAKAEQVQMNTERLDRHDERITVLEQQSGIPTDR